MRTPMGTPIVITNNKAVATRLVLRPIAGKSQWRWWNSTSPSQIAVGVGRKLRATNPPKLRRHHNPTSVRIPAAPISVSVRRDNAPRIGNFKVGIWFPAARSARETLTRLRVGRRVSTIGLLFSGFRHYLDVGSPVSGASFGSCVRLARLFRSITHRDETIRGEVITLQQIINRGFCSLFAQDLISICTAYIVCIALDADVGIRESLSQCS